MSNPGELENPKETENLEAITERYGKLIEKLQIQKINKIRELKELGAPKKELEELKKEKINEQ